jgi:hypothetical protein
LGDIRLFAKEGTLGPSRAQGEHGLD